MESFNRYDNQILEFLEKKETATTKEISEILNLSDRRVREILKDLQNKNLIKKIGKGPATCYTSK
ncbi:MAG: winged helix-turn-helix domain-containing protein [Cetobacterium sp.]